MKKILVLMIVTVMAASMAVPAFAVTNSNHLIDEGYPRFNADESEWEIYGWTVVDTKIARIGYKLDGNTIWLLDNVEEEPRDNAANVAKNDCFRDKELEKAVRDYGMTGGLDEFFAYRIHVTLDTTKMEKGDHTFNVRAEYSDGTTGNPFRKTKFTITKTVDPVPEDTEPEDTEPEDTEPEETDPEYTGRWWEGPAANEPEAGAMYSLDRLFVNENDRPAGDSQFGAVGPDGSDVEIEVGEKIYIIGWAVDTENGSQLDKIVYTINDGKNIDCAGPYRDRPDVAQVLGLDASAGVGAGFGRDSAADGGMLELKGIDKLPDGTYEIAIKAVFKDGRAKVFEGPNGGIGVFTLIVGTGEAEPDDSGADPSVTTDPEETEPDETEPDETEPEETEPEETEPEETEPEETEPEDSETEPEESETEPEETEPGEQHENLYDFNDDGYTGNKDVATLYKYVSGPYAEYDNAYDVIGDGEVNNKDIVGLFRIVSAKPVENSVNESAEEVDGVLNIVIGDYQANPGDEVDVTISLVNVTGISSLKMNLDLDEKLSALTETDKRGRVVPIVNFKQIYGDYLTNAEFAEDGDLIINSMLFDAELIDDTVYATVRIKVADDAEPGELLKISVKAEQKDIFDRNLENIEAVIINRGIEVVDSVETESETVPEETGPEDPYYIHGDMNGDGMADNKDVVVLFRYVSGYNKDEDETRYDFDRDEMISNKDVVALYRLINGIVPEGHGGSAEGDLNIVVDNLDAKPGDEVSVRIKLENNEAISSLKLALSYDEKLSVMKDYKGRADIQFDIIDNDDDYVMRNFAIDEEHHTAILNWLTAGKEVTGDTVYATITFKVADDAMDGEFLPITLSADPSDVFDINLQDIGFTLVDGGITVHSSDIVTEPEEEDEPIEDTEPEETEPEETEPEETEPEETEHEFGVLDPDKLNIVIDGGLERFEAAAGREIEVKIKLINNIKISSLKIILHYDEKLSVVMVKDESDKYVPAVLDIYDPKKPEAIKYLRLDEDGHSLLLNYYNDTYYGDTTYATIRFKVSDDAEIGSFLPITGDINPNDVFYETDYYYYDIDFTLIDGGIYVVEGTEETEPEPEETEPEVTEPEETEPEDTEPPAETEPEETEPEEPVVEAKDINGDGSTDNKDVVVLFRFVSSIGEGAEYNEAYDVNNDGENNNKDVVLLFRLLSAIS